MRCAGSGVLLLLLLSMSALSVSTAEANKEGLGDNAAQLAGRKWMRGRKAMADRGHGDARKDVVMGGKGAKITGTNLEADNHAPAEVVHEEGKRSSKGSATHPLFQQGAGRHRHDDAATVASDMLRADYSVYPDPHSRRPINNDAPLDELAEKKP